MYIDNYIQLIQYNVFSNIGEYQICLYYNQYDQRILSSFGFPKLNINYVLN
jgi:hypothetical protein